MPAGPRFQELVEDEDGATGSDNAGDLGKAGIRVRYDGQNQVQHRVIEARRSERQALRISLDGNKIEAPMQRRRARVSIAAQ